MTKEKTVLRCVSLRSCSRGDEPPEEHYTTAELLSLCAAIFAALCLLSLPIVFHFVGETSSSETRRSNYSQDELFANGSSVTRNVTCSEDFYVKSDVCVPACEEWEQYSHQTTTDVSKALLAVLSLSLLSGAGVIFGSVIRHDRMFHFPSVFIVYMTLSQCALQCVNLVDIIDTLTSRTFCPSKNLLESIDHSTTFCSILGAATQYFGVQIGFWWLFYVGWICFKLNFALLSRAKLNVAHVHVVFLALGLFLPVPGIALGLFVGDFRYILSDLTPPSCVSKNPALAYYAFPFTLNIILMAGVSMLLPIIWTVHKYKRNKDVQLRLSTPELKLIAVFVFYVIVGTAAVTYHSVTVVDNSLLSPSFHEYFQCESFGLPSDCAKPIQEWYLYVLVTMYTLVSLGTFINLVYVVNWRKVKILVMRHLRSLYGRTRNQHVLVLELTGQVHNLLFPLVLATPTMSPTSDTVAI